MISIAFIFMLRVSTAHDLGKHFSRATFKLGPKTLDLWVADSEARRARGLMYVDRLGPNEGMLFVFDGPQPMSFWMKNTMIPLAIGFFDEHCRLTEVLEMNVASSVLSNDVPTYRSRGEAKFALEMNSGWYQSKVAIGAKLTPVANGASKSSSVVCK